MLAQRLRQLRLANGLSLEELAERLDGMVTRQALSKYEVGKAQPSPTVLRSLAAVYNVKIAYLFSDPLVRLEFLRFRKLAGLTKTEQSRIKSYAAQALEERINLQCILGKNSGTTIPYRELEVTSVEEAECAALEMRSRWQLGIDGLASVTDVLEDNSVHVIHASTKREFDGMAILGVARDSETLLGAAVVTRSNVPGDRQRLNLSHELGHIVMRVADGVNEERAAFRFGGAFLAPAQTLRRELGTKRRSITLDELLLVKREFGISLQALLHRLRDLGIIEHSYYVDWCRDINKLGWKKEEPEPIPPEQPTWLLRNTLRAVSEGVLAVEKAEALIGAREELREHKTSLTDVRLIARMPLAQRRSLIAKHAERLIDHYAQDTTCDDYRTGD